MEPRAYTCRPSRIELYRVMRIIWLVQVLVDIRDRISWIPEIKDDHVKDDGQGGLDGVTRLSVNSVTRGPQIIRSRYNCLRIVGACRQLVDSIFPVVHQLVLPPIPPPPLKIDAHILSGLPPSPFRGCPGVLSLRSPTTPIRRSRLTALRNCGARHRAPKWPATTIWWRLG